MIVNAESEVAPKQDCAVVEGSERRGDLLPPHAAPCARRVGVADMCVGNGDVMSRDAMLRKAWSDGMDSFLEALVDHEFYCSDYASKEQPHAEGLLQNLHDAAIRRRGYAALRNQEGKQDTGLDAASSLFMGLVTATNRRLHKGFPTVYAFLLGKPGHYASHTFVSWSFDKEMRVWEQRLATISGVAKCLHSGARAGTRAAFLRLLPYAASALLVEKCRIYRSPWYALFRNLRGILDTSSSLSNVRAMRPTHRTMDYHWRPIVMDRFPLYFFLAGTDVSAYCTAPEWNWYEEVDDRR